MAKNIPQTTPEKSNELLKKNVAAIHTSGDLGLLERKMANALLLNAYQNLLTEESHKIPIQLLCAMLGFGSNNIEKLKNALRVLQGTQIEFNVLNENGKESWKVMSMIAFGQIEAGICTYQYAPYLARRLYDPEVYATINLAIQREFQSGYALTLYENCLRYKTVGSTGWWDLEKFRRIMGITSSVYDDYRYMNREIIVKSVKHINEKSDIRIEQEVKRTGRKITHIRFLIVDTGQQSIVSHEAMQNSEIREHPTYKRLIEHGIGERLAIHWVMTNEQQAREVINYVEKKDQNKQIKGSTAGYIRKLIEDNAKIEPSAYEKKKQAKAKVETKAQEDKKEDRKASKQEREALIAGFKEFDEATRESVIQDLLENNTQLQISYRQRGLDSPAVQAQIVLYMKKHHICNKRKVDTISKIHDGQAKKFPEQNKDKGLIEVKK
jgi:plasmid replication initiation protein